MPVFNSARWLQGLVLSLLLVLAACGGDATSPSSSAVSESGETNSEGSFFPAFSETRNLGCSWPLVSDPDLINLFLPDEGATYWLTVVPAVPNGRVRIDGTYPNARYFSFTAYNAMLDSVDGLADFLIQPSRAGTSPFQTANANFGAPYTAFAVPELSPENRAPNTLYGGAFLTEGVAGPVMIIIYRLYVPAGSSTGEVPLPKLSLEDTTTGQTLLTLDMQACTPLPPDNIPPLLNPLIASSSMPEPLRQLISTRATPISKQEPVFTKYVSLAETLREAASNITGIALPIGELTKLIALNVAPNPDNKYMTSFLTRDKSSMYVIRGKAPRAAKHPSEAPRGKADLRYWSLCTNEPFTQRMVDCLIDYQVPVDKDGYFTVVVSDPDQRPLNAVEENGIGWLAWGGIYPDNSILYRHMLPSNQFKEAIQNIPDGGNEFEVMGEYYPLISYCDQETFEAAGKDPSDVFRACQASRKAIIETSPQLPGPPNAS